ncbi:transposase zinc-binding domain-containing protein [Sporolactobacillus sp. STCC-11]|uniref:transposase zinc-binding domain-containing protein n=1 Tax=Sporolactobacillus caesalpiniae TaxID=3230362 RepID=UPI0033935B4E
MDFGNSIPTCFRYRKDIKETVQKTIKCETRDLGYAKYECFGCEENPMLVFGCFTCKSCFCHKCGKNIRMIERSGWCRI